jgi:hypothetical protein
MEAQRLSSFLESLHAIEWFFHAGEECEHARLVKGLQRAWDGEGKGMLDLWGEQTHLLEARALVSLRDQEIDALFNTVAAAIGNPIYKGLSAYLDRIYGAFGDETASDQRMFDEAVFPDVMDSVKRDVCWAAVEAVIALPGFFSTLLSYYRRGRWVCSWDGNYPQGRPVVV